MTNDPIYQKCLEKAKESCDGFHALIAVDYIVPRIAQALYDQAKEIESLRQDRFDALSVKSKDGLLSSEWLLRTGKAERERDEAKSKLSTMQEAIREAIEILSKLTNPRNWAGEQWNREQYAAKCVLDKLNQIEKDDNVTE